MALVHDVQLLLGCKGNIAQLQLLFQRVLIDLFEIAVAEYPVNLEDGAAN